MYIYGKLVFMIIISILGAIAAILIVVFIHELGHFTVARCCGVRIEKFSIGFGKAFLSYTSRKTGTQYVIAMIPLGGYVKMFGEQPDQPIEDDALKQQAYTHKNVWQRMAIAFAGPLANMLLAIVAFLIVFMLGVTYVKPIVGHVIPGSIAASAGLSRGERIIAINQQPIYGWQQVMTHLLSRIGESQPVTIITEKKGIKQQHSMSLANWSIKKRNPDVIASLGLVPYRVDIPPILQRVMPDSPAAKAGLKAGDRIESVAGKPVEHWLQVLHTIQLMPGQTTTLGVLRGTQRQQLTIHIGREQHQGKVYGHIGAEVKLPPIPSYMLHTVKYGFFESIAAGANRTWNLFVLNARILGKIFSGTVSVNTLGGPISVFKTAGQASQAGWSIYLSFIGFVSIALGFINLLPIPMLDGGHILFQLIEVVIRKPVPMRYQIMGIKVGVVVILFVMVQATINDILRLV